MHSFIDAKYDQIIQACKKHGVGKLYVFGSATGDRFDIENSDIDLLVELHNSDPVAKGEALMALWDELERILERKVELLTPESIRNPVLQSNIDRTKELIYDRSGTEASL